MKIRAHLFAGCLSFLFLTIGHAQDKTAESSSYFIGHKELNGKPGEVISTSSVMEAEELKLNIDAPNGTKIPGSGSMSALSEKKITYKSADELIIEITEDKKQSNLVVGGQDNATNDEGELKGKTIKGICTDEKWKLTMVGGSEPTPKQAKEMREMEKGLNADTSSSKAFPEKSVPVGHEWTVKDSDLDIFMGSSSTGMKVSGEVACKFTKVEDVGGVKCAVIEYSGSMTATPGEDEEVIEGEPTLSAFKMDLEGKVYRAIVESPYNAKLEASGIMKLSMSKEVAPGQSMEILIEGPVEVEETKTVK